MLQNQRCYSSISRFLTRKERWSLVRFFSDWNDEKGGGENNIMEEELLEDVLTGGPLHLKVDRDEAKPLAMGAGFEATAPVKTRKGRSQHYFPKQEREERAATLDVLRMGMVINAYQNRGHLAALIDPLYIVRKPMFRPEFPSRLVLKQKRVPVNKDTLYLLPHNTSLGRGTYRMRLGDLIKELNASYCSTIGFEFTHIPDPAIKNWIRNRIETPDLRFINKEMKLECAKKLLQINEFGMFLDSSTDFVQRYAISGSETSPLGLFLVLLRASKKYGARFFVLGMRRLARFSVLHILGHDQNKIFQLMNSSMGEMVQKHCLGTTFEAKSPFNPDVKLNFVMAAGPSIPESFYPIVLGITKGVQDKEGDADGDKVWPIIIHMAKGLNAQGITYETLKLSVLPDYNTHGAIHMVFNNQMEQTLKREASMKTEYCTDVLKAIDAPIFHVNGDDIAAVYFACRMAADFRAKFKRDVVIDIVSYQRSMASRTQTKYELVRVQEKIKQVQPIVPMYLNKLQAENIVSKAQIDFWKSEVNQDLSQGWHNVLQSKNDVDMDVWSAQVYMDEIKKRSQSGKSEFATGVKIEVLREICSKLTKVPENFNIGQVQKDILSKREKLVENDSLDWVICEALAYGSLLLELKNVRISGMDINRRLHILQEDKSGGRQYNLLDHISKTQGRYQLCKSTTSQYATAGFEYGYSTAELDTLVIWEAPEGDKTSKAQVIIDNFIAGGYVMYNYHSNMICLLPHNLKCESSSKVCNGRPERFLQLSNNLVAQIELDVEKQMKDTNMILANVSTAANFFHLIRRQCYLPHRRPLVIFSPNLISSHPSSKAKLEDLSSDTRFQPYIPDLEVDNVTAQKVLFCTGKIYFDLVLEREKRGLKQDVAICRIEQICPLPYKLIVQDVKRFINVKYAWVQEEPINQGWFNFIETRLLNLPNINNIECISRPARADGGSRSVNSCFQEQQKIFDRAFTMY